MRAGIFTLLCFVIFGVSGAALARGALARGAEERPQEKTLEYRTQLVYPEGRVDLRIEMRIPATDLDFSDSFNIYIKNQNATEWQWIQGDDQVRFSKVAYTHDLSPEVTVREWVTLSSVGQVPRISKGDLGIQYLDASLKNFQVDYKILRDGVAKEFPWVISSQAAPRKLPKPKILPAPTRIIEGAYEFHYELTGNVASLTRSDGKKVSFPRRGLGVNPVFRVEDGILTLDGSPRRFDLRMFDAEVSFIGDTEESVWVKNADGDFVDPVDEADRLYPDLVAKERARIVSGTAAKLEEEAGPASLQIARSLKVRRSVKLLGPAGSGKTTEMHALARLVAQGVIPSMPRTAQIRLLSLNELAAGTKYVGELETKMAILLEMAKKLKCILLVDEFHAAVGVGVSKGNPTNIAQTMKPALESGELRMVAISTRQEWEHAFASDAAFDRRFEEVVLQAPKGEELFRKVKNSLQMKGIPVPEEQVLLRAIELSDRYAITGAQPSKVMNLLQKSATLMEERNGGVGASLPADVAAVERAASETYRIDPAMFDPVFVFQRLSHMREYLTSRVVGQREAIDRITRVWFRKLTEVGSDQTAKAILFYGPPGTGKTLTAKLAAEAGGYLSRTIEMNKYSNGDIEAFRYEVFLALRESPSTVLILDEFEKAHPRVQNAVLSMMQPGVFTVNFQDASGRRIFEEVKSSNAIFCLTSNAGQSLFEPGVERTPVGFRTQATSMEAARFQSARLSSEAAIATLVRDGISEPVLSRIEAVVGLPRPSEEEFRVALSREIDSILIRESKKQGVSFRLNHREGLIDHLMGRFSPGESDFREVGHLLREYLEPIIAQAVIQPGFRSVALVRIDWSSAVDVSKLPTQDPCPFLLLKVNRPLSGLGR